MANRETKEQFLNALIERGEWYQLVHGSEFRTRCPFCGDSTHNMHTGHLYIRIGLDDNFPMVYNCFKCNASGMITSDVMSALEVYDSNLKSSITTLNKTSDNYAAHQFLNSDKEMNIMFDYELPEVDSNNKKIKYIEKRLGTVFSDDDIKDMKVITSLQDFLLKNEIKQVMCDYKTFTKIEDHYVGFLTFGNSHILFRDISETENYRWIKYPISKESEHNAVFYSISSSIDIFSKDTITINLAEGVLDILSAKYNLDRYNGNAINIAVGGKQYTTVLRHLLRMGFVGSNIVLNIYADNDAKFNKKSKDPTDVTYFKKILSHYKYLFKNVNIYYNVIDKDIGVPKDKIVLDKFRI